MKTLLFALLTFNVFGQTPEPVREFKIYSSNDAANLGAPIFSGNVPASKMKDFVSFVLSNKDVVLPVDPVTPPTTPVAGVPALPFVIAWTPHPETSVKGYKVTYWPENKPEITLETTKTRVSVEGLLANTTYFFNVRAVSSSGLAGAPSANLTYRQDSALLSAPVLLPTEKRRMINVLMSTDGGTTYSSIGKVIYPKITGQKYKTLIVEE